jgi:hypothetical protein
MKCTITAAKIVQVCSTPAVSDLIAICIAARATQVDEIMIALVVSTTHSKAT